MSKQAWSSGRAPENLPPPPRPPPPPPPLPPQHAQRQVGPPVLVAATPDRLPAGPSAVHSPVGTLAHCPTVMCRHWHVGLKEDLLRSVRTTAPHLANGVEEPFLMCQAPLGRADPRYSTPPALPQPAVPNQPHPTRPHPTTLHPTPPHEYSNSRTSRQQQRCPSSPKLLEPSSEVSLWHQQLARIFECLVLPVLQHIMKIQVMGLGRIMSINQELL